MKKQIVAALIVMGLCGTAVVFSDKAVADDQNEADVEKVSDIAGTKSALYYCTTTDHYLIYSKKSGNWLELSDEGEILELRPADAPIPEPSASINGIEADK